jgi:shikimate 5-dehydrogenase
MQRDPQGHDLVVNATPLGMKEAIRCRWTRSA